MKDGGGIIPRCLAAIVVNVIVPVAERKERVNWYSSERDGSKKSSTSTGRGIFFLNRLSGQKGERFLIQFSVVYPNYEKVSLGDTSTQ